MLIISSISNDDNTEEVIIVYNGTSIDNYDVNTEISLSNSKEWSIIADDKLAGIEIITKVIDSKIPTIKSHSAIILHGTILKKNK